MNSRKAFYLVVWITWLSTSLFGQDLVLKNGNAQKKFKTGTFIRIIIPSVDIEPCETCRGDYITGKIISYRDGLLTLEAFRTGQLLSENGKMIGHSDFTYTKNAENRQITIPQNEILSVAPQGKKKYKQTTTGQGIGFVAIVFGLGHITAIPFADENRDVLGVLGLSELVLGIIFATNFDHKEYVTSIDCPTASPKPENIWKLE